MASESRGMGIVPLNGSNYPTWKVLCRMALMKDGLWSIADGSEACPPSTEAEKYRKFVARRDRALAVIVLSVEPSLLYLIGDPQDPTTVWQKLAGQFQKKTWANKLQLRRKLHSLRLKDGDSVQEHIKAMAEIFNGLSVAGDPVAEEDRVVHLLASLPESYNILVTAFEANPNVPVMDVVTERLLHEERKQQDRAGTHTSGDKAMTTEQRSKRKGPRCHYCRKFGHIKRDCYELAQAEKKFDSSQKEKKRVRHKVHTVEVKRRDSSGSGDETVGMVVKQALSASAGRRLDSWVVDSGATCHMCNDDKLFVEFHSLKQPQEVALGDGHALEATGYGIVALVMKLPDGKTKRCELHDVLHVPKLSFNLLSVSKATEAGKTTRFSETGCQILNANRKLIAAGSRIGSLYYLDCQTDCQQINTAENQSQGTKENIWHRRYGHLGVQSLQKLAKDRLTEGFDYNMSNEIGFCEPCTKGKHHRSPFPTDGGKQSEEPLGLVHSDVCGKTSEQSLSGGEYFLTFIDDKTRYMWMYVLKRKDQVFERFLEWKVLVEKSTGRKLKVLCTDRGGEYTSTEFESYLKSEGVRHELTIPKTPEQNGVAERMNRTLVEIVRAMLADAKLPHRFWAEALSTAVYLRNRSPTKAVKEMTPSEAWTGEKPKVDHLRTFGCAVYAHVAKDERHKLDPKAKKCILLGYGTKTKGYRLYDPKRARVFYSRDVLFNESDRGVEKEPTKHEETRHVELDSFTDEEPVADEAAEPVLRRSGRERRPPDFYGGRVTVANGKLKEPVTMEEVLVSPDKAKWQNAMSVEIESLHANDVWDMVELPKDRKAVGSKWVFKLKVDADGSVVRHKARLVAQGYSQKLGVNCDETSGSNHSGQWLR